jgi:hypothetical protein
MNTLHAIDLENLMGTAMPRPVDVRFAYASYAIAVEPDDTDRWVLATSHTCAHKAWMAWPVNCCRLTRSGPDGADLALLRFLDVPQNLNRVERVVIGSGDGIFVDRARELRAMGAEVIVVARPGSIARALSAVADEVRFIPTLGRATNDTDLTLHA